MQPCDDDSDCDQLVDSSSGGSEPDPGAMGPFEQFMLGVIVLGIVLVLGKMAIRDALHQWTNCDSNTVLSKHEYCTNVTDSHILAWSI